MRAGGAHRESGSQQAAAIAAAPASQTQETDHQVGAIMAYGARDSRVLFLGASVLSFALLMGDACAGADGGHASERSTRNGKNRQNVSRRKPQAETAGVRRRCMNANAQAGGAPVQSLDTITVAASKTEERAIDALAPVSVVTLEQIQGLQPNRLVRHLLQCSRRLVPGSRRRSVDRHQYPRPAGFRPRRRRRRRRAAELSAHRPQRQRLVLPRSGTGRRRRRRARSDRQHLRLRRDRRRGLVPHQGHPGRRASRRALGRRHDRLLRHQQRPWPRLDLRRRARQSRMSIFSAARSTARRAITRTATAPRSATPATRSPAA